MNLADVARRFDRTTMWDAYNGKKLAATCQVTAWDSPRRDGLTTIRRTLYTAYGARLPDRRAVVIGAETWLLAEDPAHDTYGRDVSRVGYIAQQAHLGKVATTAQVLDDAAEEVFLSRVWVKDVKDISTTSEAQGQYYIYFARGEAVRPGTFLHAGGLWHICRNVISGTAGLMIAECNELDPDCVVQVEVQGSGKWDPVTETYGPSTTLPLRGIRMTWKDDYALELPSSEKEQVGDVRIRFKSVDAAHLKTDARITLRGDVWQLVSRSDKADDSVSTVWRRVA